MHAHAVTPHCSRRLCALLGALALTAWAACSETTGDALSSSSLGAGAAGGTDGVRDGMSGMGTLVARSPLDAGESASEGSKGSAGAASSTSRPAEDAGSSDAGGDPAGGGVVAGDAGSVGPCTGGVSWQRLDGLEECVHPPVELPIVACESFDAACCSNDAECTDGAGGRCVSKLATYLGCGGAVPFGNGCNYDQCASDADCVASAPAGAPVAACGPAGGLGLYTAACIYGGCRTDRDCTLHAGGQCRFGEAATHATCDRRRVFFCAYPSDPCQSDSDCPQSAAFLLCLPEESYQGRHCAPAPPMYP